MQLSNVSRMPDLAAFRGLANRRTLLVDSDVELLKARHLLLAACNCVVQAAQHYRDVYQLATANEPNVAILSDSLGPFQLKAIAECIRRRWPQVRILIIGRPASMLEDHLYDDAVDPHFNAREFLAAVERCYRSRS